MELETRETPSPATENAEEEPIPLKISKAWILLEFLLFGSLYVWAEQASLVLPITWGQTQFSLGKIQTSPPALALVAVALLYINGGIRNLNFSWPVLWKRYLCQLLLVLVGFLLISNASSWFKHLLWGRSPERDEIVKIFANTELKSFFFLMLPLWAFTEEIFYRAYLIQRIERLASDWRYPSLLAVFASAMAFTLGHLQYGLSNLPVYIFLASILSGIYLYTKRNIWFVSIVHWLSNTWLLMWE